MQINATFSIIMVIIFIFGFVMLGIKLKNNYLILSSLFLLITNAFYILNNFLLSSNSLKMGSSNGMIGVSLLLGLLAYPFGILFFGIGLFKLKNKLGKTAKIAGLLEISVLLILFSSYIFFMILPTNSSIIYFLVVSIVYLVFITAKLLEAKILYDVSKDFK